MCIAIYNGNGSIKRKSLKNCWVNNDDGAGIVYFEKGKMKIYKELGSFKKFWKYYRAFRTENPEKPCLLHFRIATHGEVDEANCHPFPVTKEIAFCHNGILSDYGSYASKKSDTRDFGESVLEMVDMDFSDKERFLLGKIIGTANKMIFLHKDDSYMIVNEEEGKWDNGNWYSNETYKYQYTYSYPDYGFSGTTTVASGDTEAWNNEYKATRNKLLALDDDEYNKQFVEEEVEKMLDQGWCDEDIEDYIWKEYGLSWKPKLLSP